jgi:hypothetical protein
MPFIKILTDDEKNSALEKDGYTIVPFLNHEEIKRLTDFFYQDHPNLPEGMYASSHAKDFRFRKKMNEEIQSVCENAISNTFKNTQALGATFMVKSKGENGSLHPHQDWSIVDENHFYSYNVWLPLVDVNESNGTLLILPDSHRIFNNIRGLNIPSSYENVINEVWSYLIPINMKAGEALIYDHRLLHASGINKTDIPRLVIVYGVIPQQATMRYFFGNGNEIEEYACTSEFYFNKNITQGPADLQQLSVKQNNNPIIDVEFLKVKYDNKLSLVQKIYSYFNKEKKR